MAIPHGDRLPPVAAPDAWLEAGRVAEGLVFCRICRAGQLTDEPISDRAVVRLVHAVAKTAGYDPALFGGHPLRAGFITSPARCGASIFKFREISRHRNLGVPPGYVSDAQVYCDHAACGFFARDRPEWRTQAVMASIVVRFTIVMAPIAGTLALVPNAQPGRICQPRLRVRFEV